MNTTDLHVTHLLSKQVHEKGLLGQSVLWLLVLLLSPYSTIDNVAPVFFGDIYFYLFIFLFISALRSRKTCFEGLWATRAHSQKVQCTYITLNTK